MVVWNVNVAANSRFAIFQVAAWFNFSGNGALQIPDRRRQTADRPSLAKSRPVVGGHIVKDSLNHTQVAK